LDYLRKLFFYELALASPSALSHSDAGLYDETLDMDKQIGTLEVNLVDLDAKILSLSE